MTLNDPVFVGYLPLALASGSKKSLPLNSEEKIYVYGLKQTCSFTGILDALQLPKGLQWFFIQPKLVGGIPTPLKNKFVSCDEEIPE